MMKKEKKEKTKYMKYNKSHYFYAATSRCALLNWFFH